MKRLTSVVFSLILVLLLTACGHTHTWQEATCTLPETCSACGETRGEALGHTWIEATCGAEWTRMGSRNLSAS